MSQAGKAKSLKVEVTKEDKLVLKECYNESLMYRCFPLVTINCVGTYAFYKKGLIKRPILSLSFAAFMGGVVGLASYGPACRKKFAEKVPYSDFSRLYTGRVSAEDLLEEQRQSRRVHQGRQDEESVSYLKELGHGEGHFSDEDIVEDGNITLTYEELRRKNRAQFQSQPPPRSQIQNDHWNNETRPRSPQPPKSFIDTNSGKSNKYGDVWDKDS